MKFLRQVVDGFSVIINELLFKMCDIIGKSANTDKEVALRYPREIIERDGYKDEQTFNVDEIGIILEKLPSRTFIAANEKSCHEYIISKDLLTLLLGRNTTGDCKLKPMLVYIAKNSRALKGRLKNNLPVL